LLATPDPRGDGKEADGKEKLMKMKKRIKRLVARVEELEEAVDALQLDLFRLEVRVDCSLEGEDEEDGQSEQSPSEETSLSEADDEEE
jgi:hypothetical protein